MQNFDYIIIGAGSAGAVLAARLTEDADVSVLLLEAGGPDYRQDFRTQMPAALAYPLQGTLNNWAYQTDPEPHMNNRRMDCSRGKGLGGSSLINGMCYIRGNAMDYEQWAQISGLEHWNYAQCLPYFRKAETRDIGANDYHGDSGPLYVTTPKADNNELFAAMIEAGVQAGYPRTDDLNGYQQEGFGPMDRTVTAKGRRCSTSRGYLDIAKKRPNLTIATRAISDRILFKDKRAIGVEWLQGKRRQQSFAAKEVVVCGGAIASPQLLLRSGVGPSEDLQALGIEVIQHLPGVGENLQDHLELYIQYECKLPVSLASANRWYKMPFIGAQWMLSGTGIGASNQFEGGGFIRSHEEFAWPNIQYHFLPVAVNYNGTAALKTHSFQMHVGSMRSPSRGRIKLRSRSAFEHPSILFNYMSCEQDWQEFRAAIRITRKIFSQPALKPYTGKEITPGAQVQSDAELDAFIRERGETAYHPACSNKMGPASDPMAVVNGFGQVHGLEGLRVVDASIMPLIVTGNLNAPTIMMAELIADAMRGKKLLEPSTAGFHRA